jgi:hypothetical protein
LSEPHLKDEEDLGWVGRGVGAAGGIQLCLVLFTLEIPIRQISWSRCRVHRYIELDI